MPWASASTRSLHILRERRRWLENMNTTPALPSVAEHAAAAWAASRRWLGMIPRSLSTDELPPSQQKPRVTASLICTALCPGWQIKDKQHRHLVKSQINFASLKPLQQQRRLKSPEQSCGLANWRAAWTGLWLFLNLNEFTGMLWYSSRGGKTHLQFPSFRPAAASEETWNFGLVNPPRNQRECQRSV